MAASHSQEDAREIVAAVADLQKVLDSGAGRTVLKRLLGDSRLRVMPGAESKEPSNFDSTFERALGHMASDRW
jgi:hypothetical protein